MFLKFKKGEQKKLVNQAINLAGSERKLAKETGIPKGSIYRYKHELGNLPLKRARVLLMFLKIPFKEIDRKIERKLDKHWGRKLGGENLIKKKIAEGTLKNTILLLNKTSSEWHKKMKSESPEKYYLGQYEKFKKIAHYKFKTKQGIKVRNKLEKDIADFLFNNKINFSYEPFIRIGEKGYFPDFLMGKTIIEVTFWKNPSQEKISYLKEKINNYHSEGYQVIFFIPEKYHKFYKALSDCVVISNLDKMLEIITPR